MNVSRQIWGPAVLLPFLGLVVFGNVLDAPFQYDDLHSIKYNPHIRSLSDVAHHFVDPGTFSSRVRGFMYRPVLMTSYSLDYALWGGEAIGFRLLNLLLHVIVSGLFGLLVRRWVGADAAMGAAVLFLVHPMHGETVDYISSRSDLLVAVFALGCLAVFRASALWPLLMLYVGALLSKSVAVTMPVIAATLTVAREGWSGLYRDRKRHGLLLLLTVSYLVILWSTRFLSSSYEKLPRSPLLELLTQSKALVYYLWLHSSPVHLSVDHSFTVVESAASAAVVAAVALVLSCVLLALHQRHCVPAQGVLFFGISMLPYLLVPLNIIVAERRVYLASCGLLLIAMWAWSLARRRWGQALRPIGVTLCLLFGLLTMDRNQVWASDISLWSDAVSRNTTTARPRINLALAYKRNGELETAEAQLQQGLRLDPDYAEGWVVLGQLRHTRGDSEGALSAYRRGAALDPTMAGVYHDLGNVTMHLGQVDSALVYYQRVLELNPRFAEARNNLGMALEAKNRWPEALDSYRQAVADSIYWTNTDDPVGGAWYNRARAAEALGLLQEAEHAYREAHRRLAQDAHYVDQANWARAQYERLRGEGR